MPTLLPVQPVSKVHPTFFATSFHRPKLYFRMQSRVKADVGSTLGKTGRAEQPPAKSSFSCSREISAMDQTPVHQVEPRPICCQS